MERDFQIEGDINDFYVKRWIVRNGNTVGTYGVMMRPDGTPFGSSRDYHRIATEDEIRNPPEFRTVEPCEFHCGAHAICDGSSLAEITQEDAKAFRIAESMAMER